MTSQYDLCEKVTAWLNDSAQQISLSEQFTAVHDTHGYVDQPTAGQVYVLVTQGVRSADRLTRGGLFVKTADVVVTVLERIEKRIDAQRRQRESEVIQLHEEIEDLLLGVNFDEYRREEEASASLPVQYGRPDLYENSVLNGDITISFTYDVKKTR